MVWWQSIILLFFGGLIGFFFNRLGAKSEREAIERRQLQDAIRGLLIEMKSNIKLTEKPPEPAILPRLAKDMWDIHKISVAKLPLKIQETLYRAYAEIDKVNALVETRIAFSNRKGDTPGTWDTRYESEANKARMVIKKAKRNLLKHLECIETIKTTNNLARGVQNVLSAGSENIFLKSVAVLLAIALVILIVVAFLRISDANDTSLALYTYIAEVLSALVTVLAAFFNRFKLFVGFASVFLVTYLWGQLGILIS